MDRYIRDIPAVMEVVELLAWYRVVAARGRLIARNEWSRDDEFTYQLLLSLHEQAVGQ